MALTAWAAAKAVNEALKEAGLDKQIPPQMMYNYTTAKVRAGKKPLIKTEAGPDNQVLINEQAFTEWLGRYIRKQVALSTI